MRERVSPGDTSPGDTSPETGSGFGAQPVGFDPAIDLAGVEALTAVRLERRLHVAQFELSQVHVRSHDAIPLSVSVRKRSIVQGRL